MLNRITVAQMVKHAGMSEAEAKIYVDGYNSAVDALKGPSAAHPEHRRKYALECYSWCLGQRLELAHELATDLEANVRVLANYSKFSATMLYKDARRCGFSQAHAEVNNILRSR